MTQPTNDDLAEAFRAMAEGAQDFAEGIRGLAQGVTDLAERVQAMAEGMADAVPDQVMVPPGTILPEGFKVTPLSGAFTSAEVMRACEVIAAASRSRVPPRPLGGSDDGEGRDAHSPAKCDHCGHVVHDDAETPAGAASWDCPACRVFNLRPRRGPMDRGRM